MRRRPLILMIALTVAMGVSAAGIRDAEAQNLFDFLGRLFGGPRFHIERETTREYDYGGSNQIYCVRLCDGAFFPLSPGKGKSDPEQLCNSLCPASKTAIYRGGKIDNAVSERGASYSNLKKAFLYRERIVEQCTCSGRIGGTAAIDVASDPTLRPGDYVVTAAGVKKFNGSKSIPYAASAFTPAKLDNVIPAPIVPEPVMSLRVHPRPEASEPSAERQTPGAQTP